ncbi:hypothetical protein [Paludisphaera sp.]|uniref:hypothetical protein n=1 Tax=Paludisphaera sp. TaxID=2017432 RepID=UPI00301C3F12
MPLLSALIVASGVGLAQGPPSELAEAAATPLAANVIAAPAVPEIMFEIRELAMGSPDWRGAMQPALSPIAREEAVSAWAVDGEGMRRLMEICEADRDSTMVLAPRLAARLGEPVRMTNENAVQYVAHLKRISDSPPGEGTNVAFQPELAEVHDGVRVVLTETRLKGSVLQAHVVVQASTVLNMLTTEYEESVGPVEADPGVVKASFLQKLNSDSPHRASLRGTIQIPEVASRRIEGEWLIPSDGAIVISMGPESNAKLDRKPYGEKAGGLGLPFGGKGARRGYAERVICITAHVNPAAVDSAPPDVPARP